MRAIIVWILTLTSGFAAFMMLATLALLPMQAAKNRAIYSVVDQYAHRFAEAQTLPRNAEVDDAFAETTDGVRIWRSLPGGCDNIAFEASSDRFALGFWDNGSGDRFGSTWWHCYAFPSRNTTLQLSVADYLRSAAGQRILAYALVTAVAGYLAFLLRSRRHFRDLRPWPKAIWFGAFMTIILVFSVVTDKGDDQFFENPESVKWFAVVYEDTIGSITKNLMARPIYFLDDLLNTGGHSQNILFLSAIFGMWIVIGWTAGRLVSFARRRLSTR